MKAGGFIRGVFWLALALRSIFLIIWVWKGLAPTFGQDLYYSLATSWLGWAPPVAMDATHPPLYTFFIAAVLFVFRGPNPLPVLCIQTLLSSAGAPMIYHLGTRLASERAARVAGLWVALDPCLIFFTPHLQTETFFIFMEILFFLWLYRCVEGEGSFPGEFFPLGFLGGLASLCRSVFAAYPAALFLVLLHRRGLKKVLLPFLLFSVGWLSPISIWTARNWGKYHTVIPIAALMGHNLYEGFTLDREEVRRRPWKMAEEVKQHGADNPIAENKYFQAKVARFIREHPGESAKIILGKALLFWRPLLYDPYPLPVRVTLAIYFLLLFLSAAFGVWRNRAGEADWWPIYALFIYLTAMHSVFFTSLRYRMPLEPFLCLLAAVGVEYIEQRWWAME